MSAGSEIVVAGKTVDLAKAFPITIGDAVELETLGLMDKQGNLAADGMGATLKLLAYFGRKACPDLTEDDVRAVALADLQDILATFQRVSQEVAGPRPTGSTSSTSSPANTGGRKRTSTS